MEFQYTSRQSVTSGRFSSLKTEHLVSPGWSELLWEHSRWIEIFLTTQSIRLQTWINFHICGRYWNFLAQFRCSEYMCLQYNCLTLNFFRTGYNHKAFLEYAKMCHFQFYTGSSFGFIRTIMVTQRQKWSHQG